MVRQLLLLCLLGIAAVGAIQLDAAAGALAECGTSCGCQPWCHWNCTVPIPKTICRPVCLKPKCHVACEPVKCLKCSAKCTMPEPKCRILCPKLGCVGGACPGCKHVCDPAPACKVTCAEPETPRCVPQCETKCWKKCDTEFMNEVDRPECEMVCGFPDCPSNCRQSMPTQCAKKTEAPPKCCKCAKARNTATAMHMADSTCTSPECKRARKPSLLEVMDSMQSRGASCCPCGEEKSDAETDAEWRANAADEARREEKEDEEKQQDREMEQAQEEAQEATARSEVEEKVERVADENKRMAQQLLEAQQQEQVQAAQMLKLEKMAAFGVQEAAKEKEQALEKLDESPLLSSYRDLAAQNSPDNFRPVPSNPFPPYPGPAQRR